MLAGNGFAACFVWDFETVSTEMLLTKILCSWTFAKQNIDFPEGTAFANAYTNARIRQRCCYVSVRSI
jgi:hypothetical protein